MPRRVFPYSPRLTRSCGPSAPCLGAGRVAVVATVLGAVVLLSGCVVAGTLQTPEVQAPGVLLVGAGFTAESLIGISSESYGDERPVLSEGKVYARCGVLPRTELGVQFGGLDNSAAGAFDARYQLLRRPLLVAAGVGYGKAELRESCPEACDLRRVTTTYTGVVFGRERVYGALRLLRYAVEEEREPEESRQWLVPGLSLGMTRRTGAMQSLGEVNVYYMDGFALSIGFGVQYRYDLR